MRWIASSTRRHSYDSPIYTTVYDKGLLTIPPQRITKCCKHSCSVVRRREHHKRLSPVRLGSQHLSVTPLMSLDVRDVIWARDTSLPPAHYTNHTMKSVLVSSSYAVTTLCNQFSIRWVLVRSYSGSERLLKPLENRIGLLKPLGNRILGLLRLQHSNRFRFRYFII